jgi:hypothetical protein
MVNRLLKRDKVEIPARLPLFGACSYGELGQGASTNMTP